MIKAIVIDIGGVYIKGTRNDLFSFLSKKFKVDFKSSIGELYQEFNDGKITPEKFWREASNKLKINESILKKSWLNALKAIFTINENFEEIIKNMKKLGYKIATITNTNKFHFDFHKKFGHYKYFDVVIASFEVGIQKPDERIYVILMQKLNLQPKEILFIDNSGDNLSIAKKLGMETLIYTDLEDLKKNLSDLDIQFSDLNL